MTDKPLQPGATPPEGRKFRPQSGAMDNFKGEPLKQTKTAADVMGEHDQPPIDNEEANTSD